MNLTPTVGRDNFIYSCTCSGYLDFAFESKADKIPIASFENGFNTEKNKKSSVYIIEGNFRSPIFKNFNVNTPNLNSYIDLWSWYVNTSSLNGGENLVKSELFYVSEMTGLLASHVINENQNINIEATLGVESNETPVAVSSKIEFSENKNESFAGEKWRTIIYEDENTPSKYLIQTELYPTIEETKSIIESKISVESKEIQKYIAIANNSEYKFSVELLDLNEKICNGQNDFTYTHVSGDDIWDDVSKVIVKNRYNVDENKCICEISGITSGYVSPSSGEMKTYNWDFNLKRKQGVIADYLTFKGRHTESTTPHPILKQALHIVQNGSAPQPDGSYALTWNIAFDIYDDERNIDKTPGLNSTTIGESNFISINADENLLSRIEIESLTYENNKYNLALIIKNIDIAKFTNDHTNKYHSVTSNIKANIRLDNGNVAQVELKNLKFKLPKYIDQDNDGIPDFSDLCPGFSSQDNNDTDNDGIGDPCDECPQDPLNKCKEVTGEGSNKE